MPFSLQILLPSTLSTFHHFSRPLHFTSHTSLALCTTRCYYSYIQTQTQEQCYDVANFPDEIRKNLLHSSIIPNPKNHLLFSSSYHSVRLLSSSYKNEGLRWDRFLKGEAKRPTRELAVVKRVLSDCRRIELFL